MITLERLSKVYAGEGQPALDNISLSVPDGAIYGILGRSGAGKSTLIRCLNLLERPTSGRIIMNGKDITTLSQRELRQHRQRTGMVFQHFNLIHARNVADNIAVPLEIAGQPRPEREKRVAELLELVGLSDKARAFPSQLSGGQKQRVGIARALAAHPDILLCDEATSALDPENHRLGAGATGGHQPQARPDHRAHHPPAGGRESHLRSRRAAGKRQADRGRAAVRAAG